MKISDRHRKDGKVATEVEFPFHIRIRVSVIAAFLFFIISGVWIFLSSGDFQLAVLWGAIVAITAATAIFMMYKSASVEIEEKYLERESSEMEKRDETAD